MQERGEFSHELEYGCVQSLERDMFSPCGFWRVNYTLSPHIICKQHYTPHYFVFDSPHDYLNGDQVHVTCQVK